MKKAFLFLSLAVIIATSAVMSRAAQSMDAVGTWEITTNSPEGTRTNIMVIRREGNKLKAVLKGQNGERDYDSIELQGSQITIVLTINYQGTPMVVTYSGTIDKEGMRGEADFGGLAQGTWSAVPKNPQ